MGEELFRELSELITEARNPATADLDRLDALGIVRRLNEQDEQVPAAVRAVLPEIARVAQMAAASFAAGGRLIYVGAGTSGRLGVLDAAECPPTFGSPPEQVVGLIAGGPSSLLRSAEGVEDKREAGVADLTALSPTAQDTVIGLSASHRTPYTVAAVEAAQAAGAASAFITANAVVAVPGDVVIRLLVGPEAIAGSTRLKAGTAQKMTLNMISSAAMILTGKVYGNLMVDLKPLSAKLVERGRGVVAAVTGLDYAGASALLERAGGKVKLALMMELGRVDAQTAAARLEAAGGRLAAALEALRS